MSKEQLLNHLIICRKNLQEQNDLFEQSISEDLRQFIYDNQIRISELTRVINYIEGEW